VLGITYQKFGRVIFLNRNLFGVKVEISIDFGVKNTKMALGMLR
jgi:hypothetical protein